MDRSKEHIDKAFVSINMMAGCFLLFSSSIIWQIYIYGQLKSLLQQYGFAKIPAGELPIGVEYSDNIVFGLFVVWLLSIAIGLFYANYQLYLILKTTFKKQMYYTYRMTVVSTLIPIFNLYRPWAGLSEIRKEFVSRRRRNANYKDYVTIVFAVFLIISLLVIIRTLSYISLITNHTEAYTSGFFDALIIFELVYFSLVVFVTFITYFYCYNVIDAARDITSR
jgi:hypothetical protein